LSGPEEWNATTERLVAATEDAMDEAVRRVNAKFDELEAILTGSDPKSRRQGRPSLEELIRVAGTDAPAAFQRRTHL
jgi:hypothetical protein